MRRVAIVTDSAANLPADLINQYRIYVVPVLLYVNGREYRDGVDIQPVDVYRHMREATNGTLPRTASPTVGEFFRVYTLAAQDSEEIVSIHLSANLSAVVQGALTACDLVNARVHVVDSHTAAMGCGFAVLEAARLAQTGADAHAVIQRARDVAGKARVVAMLDRLDYLHRGGHVPAIASLAGSALRLCPILTISNDHARVTELPRTRARAVERIKRLLRQNLGNRPAHIAVMHADALSEAEQLYDYIVSNFTCEEAFITEFTPVMGSHTGPGVLGVAYHQDDPVSGSG